MAASTEGAMASAGALVVEWANPQTLNMTGQPTPDTVGAIPLAG